MSIPGDEYCGHLSMASVQYQCRPASFSSALTCSGHDLHLQCDPGLMLVVLSSGYHDLSSSPLHCDHLQPGIKRNKSSCDHHHVSNNISERWVCHQILNIQVLLLVKQFICSPPYSPIWRNCTKLTAADWMKIFQLGSSFSFHLNILQQKPKLGLSD